MNANRKLTPNAEAAIIIKKGAYPMKKVFSLILAFFLTVPVLACAEGFHTNPSAIDEAANSVLYIEVFDRKGNMLATGSGFCAFDANTLVTNHHVIEDSSYLIVYTDDNESFRVDTIYAASEDNDLALLRFDNTLGITPLTICMTTADLLRGEPVVAIGSPEGYQNTVSTGIISAFRTEEVFREIQFTAPISSGSSGGALFNDNGEVIGVTYATLKKGQNLNYSIDISYAISLYNASDTVADSRTLDEFDQYGFGTVGAVSRQTGESLYSLPESAYGSSASAGTQGIQFWGTGGVASNEYVTSTILWFETPAGNPAENGNAFSNGSGIRWFGTDSDNGSGSGYTGTDDSGIIFFTPDSGSGTATDQTGTDGSASGIQFFTSEPGTGAAPDTGSGSSGIQWITPGNDADISGSTTVTPDTGAETTGINFFSSPSTAGDEGKGSPSGIVWFNNGD